MEFLSRHVRPIIQLLRYLYVDKAEKERWPSAVAGLKRACHSHLFVRLRLLLLPRMPFFSLHVAGRREISDHQDVCLSYIIPLGREQLLSKHMGPWRNRLCSSGPEATQTTNQNQPLVRGVRTQASITSVHGLPSPDSRMDNRYQKDLMSRGCM